MCVYIYIKPIASSYEGIVKCERTEGKIVTVELSFPHCTAPSLHSSMLVFSSSS